MGNYRFFIAVRLASLVMLAVPTLAVAQEPPWMFVAHINEESGCGKPVEQLAAMECHDFAFSTFKNDVMIQKTKDACLNFYSLASRMYNVFCSYNKDAAEINAAFEKRKAAAAAGQTAAEWQTMLLESSASQVYHQYAERVAELGRRLFTAKDAYSLAVNKLGQYANADFESEYQCAIMGQGGAVGIRSYVPSYLRSMLASFTDSALRVTWDGEKGDNGDKKDETPGLRAYVRTMHKAISDQAGKNAKNAKLAWERTKGMATAGTSPQAQAQQQAQTAGDIFEALQRAEVKSATLPPPLTGVQGFIPWAGLTVTSTLAENVKLLNPLKELAMQKVGPAAATLVPKVFGAGAVVVYLALQGNRETVIADVSLTVAMAPFPFLGSAVMLMVLSYRDQAKARKVFSPEYAQLSKDMIKKNPGTSSADILEAWSQFKKEDPKSGQCHLAAEAEKRCPRRTIILGPCGVDAGVLTNWKQAVQEIDMAIEASRPKR